MNIRRYMQLGAAAASGVVFASSADAQLFRANVAEGKPASQISTGFGRGPQLAVNGNLGEPGTHTTGGDAPPLWWEVDLLETFAIDEIQIFNRDDCCPGRLSDFNVMILDENRVQVWNSGEINDGAIYNGGGEGGPSNDYFFDFANGEFRIQVGNNTTLLEETDYGAQSFAGRFLRVEKNIGGILTLNEVRAFALTDFLARPVIEVNRDTGAIRLKNNTGNALQIIGYSITSAVGALDRDNWRSLAENPVPDGVLVQNNGHWFEFSAPGSTTDLSEGSLAELFLDHQGNLNLTQGDGVWIQNPTEDVQILLKLANGNNVQALVEFVGNNGSPFAVGDLDFDGDIDIDDWMVLRDGLLSNLSGLSRAQGYQLGDLNGDGRSDITDFANFKSIFESIHGQDAFAALVPEPASLALLGIGLVGLSRRRRV